MCLAVAACVFHGSEYSYAECDFARDFFIARNKYNVRSREHAQQQRMYGSTLTTGTAQCYFYWSWRQVERAQLYSSEGGMLGRSRIVGLADMALRATYNEAQGDGNDVAKNGGWNWKR
jgi:hypothetical protein